MIRLISPAEVPLLIPQARAFFKEGNIQGTLNEPHFIQTLTAQMLTGRMFVFAEGSPFRGAIGATMFEDLATGETCCLEYFFYVDVHERGSLGIRLLAAFEEHAFCRGAVRLMMMHHVTEKSEKFKHFYERRGYTLREQVFVKVNA